VEALSELAVARAVVEGRPPDQAPVSPPRRGVSDETCEAEVEARRIARERRWLQAVPSRLHARTPIVGRPRRRSPLLTLCAAVTLTDATGRVEHCGLVALRLRSPRALDAFSNAARRTLATEIATSAREQWVDAVLCAAAGALDAAAAQHQRRVEILDRREAAMLGVRHSAARALVQPGLFDARGQRALEHREAISAQLTQEAAERGRAAELSRALTCSVELVGLT
jgi:hypothetical protein